MGQSRIKVFDKSRSNLVSHRGVINRSGFLLALDSCHWLNLSLNHRVTKKCFCLLLVFAQNETEKLFQSQSLSQLLSLNVSVFCPMSFDLLVDMMMARKTIVLLVGYLFIGVGGLDNSELLLRKRFRVKLLVTSTGKHICQRIYSHPLDQNERQQTFTF